MKHTFRIQAPSMFSGQHMEFDGLSLRLGLWIHALDKVLLSLGSHLDPMKPMETCHGTGLLLTGLVTFTPKVSDFIRAPAHVPTDPHMYYGFTVEMGFMFMCNPCMFSL